MLPTFVERQDDGTEITYLLLDFTPATKDTCEMVKIKYPDGRVTFGFPVRNKELENSQ